MSKKHFHFSGVCGTAMASLAVLLKNRGHKITGSDQNVYPPMSDLLKENGIDIQSPYQKENLVPHPDYVVLGNALSRGNPEVEYALEAHLHYLSMAELLKNEFIRGNTSVVISGTHGKTTTTSLAAHLFHECGKPTGFMIGGIPENFEVSSRDVEKGGYFIVEGDEYDTSLFDKRSKFFHYLPDRVIINNIEFDHADIFTDLSEIKKSFSLMLRQVPANGLVIVNGDDPHALEVAESGYSPVISYGFDESCDAVISAMEVQEGSPGMKFNLTFQGKEQQWQIPLLGGFNVKNAVSVILLALNEGIPADQIQAALSGFKNVKRRLQQLTKTNTIRVFDDFAHHPTAIRETIDAVRKAWPESRLHAIFEARSNTSVRSFHQERMSEAFRGADTITFYKLHREDSIAPGEKLNIEKIMSELNRQGKQAQQLTTLEDILEYTGKIAESGDIFLVMSNGGFGGIQHQIAAEMDRRC
jgi:UDP-N-acetylmuramate: L-alanyl-gamma-D-glutamyl-meso-diaminopimelate ligase